jgi:hypothetical protein
MSNLATTEDDGFDMGLSQVAGIYTVLSIVLGIPAPALGAGFGIAAAGLSAAEKAVERRKSRSNARLRQVLIGLTHRVKGLEERQLTDEEFDLFVEVTQKLVQDDEDAKACYYEGILAWILREKPTPAQVRVLSDAVRGLTFVELHFFIRETHGLHSDSAAGHELEIEVMRSRLERSGISSGSGIYVYGNPSKLGKILKEFCPLEVVDKADEARRRSRQSKAGVNLREGR